MRSSMRVIFSPPPAKRRGGVGGGGGGGGGASAAFTEAAVPADRLPTPDLESELRSPRTPPRAMRVEGGEFI
jgi:hypothetical protein